MYIRWLYRIYGKYTFFEIKLYIRFIVYANTAFRKSAAAVSVLVAIAWSLFLSNYLREETYSVVIMDNCSIHLDRRVRELIEGAGAIILYSAAYSPELIPIEAMFSQWKAYLKRHFVEFNDSWYEVHQAALGSITPQQGLNYFRHTTLVHLVSNHPLSEEFRESQMRLAIDVAAVLVGLDFV